MPNWQPLKQRLERNYKCGDCGRTERLRRVGQVWLCDPCWRNSLRMERFHDY